MPEADAVRRLVLADGTVLDQSECGYAERKLWCYLKNLTFADAFQIFSNPDKIGVIKFEYGLTDQYTRITYTGFTDIQTITSRELSIDVCVTGDNTSITTEEVVV